MTKPLWWGLSFIMAIVALVTWAEAQSPQPVEPVQPEQVQPKEPEMPYVYAMYCDQCHAQDSLVLFDGTQKLDEQGDPDYIRSVGPMGIMNMIDKEGNPMHAELIRSNVRFGINAMPAFRATEVSDKELEDIVTYLKNLASFRAATVEGQ